MRSGEVRVRPYSCRAGGLRLMSLLSRKTSRRGHGARSRRARPGLYGVTGMGDSPGGVSATILNVDDDLATRYAVTRTLQRAGFTVREASTGQEALALARENPDLILLDVQLPDITGFEVCQRLKADPATAPIPVLQMS